MKYAFPDTIPTTRTVLGVFDFITSGNFSYFSIGHNGNVPGSTRYEMLAKRYSDTMKLNLATYLDQHNVVDLVGEAVGIQAFSYSFSGSSYRFLLQGQTKSQLENTSDFLLNYSQGVLALGCSAVDGQCTTQVNPSFNFYELLVYE